MASPRRASAAAALLLLALADPAAARAPHSGPTSSGTVNISVSVAPKYELKAGGPAIHALPPGASASGTFCIATNGQPTVLPVLLVSASAGPAGAGRTAAETSVPLAWCDPDGGTPPAGRLGMGGEPPALLIIRPE